jgi:glycine cleavage system H protein
MAAQNENKMDGFSYNNIFETKGIEYIAILAFFALLIPFWIMLNKRAVIARQIRKTIGMLTAAALRIPLGLYYSENHTWSHLEKSGVAKVGLDDLLLHITGEVQFKTLKKEGEKIGKGDLLAEIEHNGKTLMILSPLTGEVAATNPVLTENPGLLNEDPYQKGWMYEIRPTNWVAETSKYYVASEATTWVEKELAMFKDFLSISIGNQSDVNALPILQDGGELADHTLSELPVDVWQNFQEDFLSQTDRGTKHRLAD